MSSSAEAHIVFTADIPALVDLDDASAVNLKGHLQDVAKEDLAAATREFFTPPASTAVSIEYTEGPALRELLTRARDLDVDLILVGAERDGPRPLAEKLARKAPCSVFIAPTGTVPERGEVSFSRLLVPVDFSDSSGDALDVAVAFADAEGSKSLDVLHAYRLPLGYHRIGKTADEMETIMRQNAGNRMDRFLSEADLRGLTVRSHFVHNSFPEQAVAGYVEAHDVDLAVVGSSGKTEGAAVLLGSVAEEIVREIPVPFVCVRRKGVTLDVLDALLRL